MATTGDTPETLIAGRFSGIRNTVAFERLQPADLAAAVNVVLDDADQLSRRRGYEKRAAGNFHSITRAGDRVFGVKNNQIGELFADASFVELAPGDINPVAFLAVGDTVYYSSRSVSGKIVGNIVVPWGLQDGGGRWLSPVVMPTPTLGAISGKLLGAPPNATLLEHYRGRIYLGHERLLWATELYLYDQVDRTRNFIQFEEDLTLVEMVKDGLFVGTTRQLLFLQGSFGQGMKQLHVMDAGVVPGSCVRVPAPKVHPNARTGNPVPEDDLPVFMTNRGICVGTPGGAAFNLTQDRMVFPDAISAAALYREDQGANLYVAAANSAGGPATNARIGDYVDAQIVRASRGDRA